MEEIKIIQKLESLKAIKPNNEWVNFAKREVISKQFDVESSTVLSNFVSTIYHAFETPKVLTPVLSGLIVAIFGFAIVTSQNTFPGEIQYSIKKAYSQMAMSFMTSEEQTVERVKQVDQILAQLDKISKEGENQSKKLEASVNEARQVLSVVTKELNNLPEDSQKAGLVEQVVSSLNSVSKTISASISEDNEDYQAIYKFFIESEIKNLEANKNNLNTEQFELLERAKENFLIGNYLEAMDLINQIQPKAIEEE